VVGSSTRVPLLSAPDAHFVADDWSHDGQYVVYLRCARSGDACGEAWALPLAGPREPRLVAAATAQIDEPHVSPDGRSVAYGSNDSGRWEVYLQPFLQPGERRRVSTNGGGQPRWRYDSRELVYLALDGTFMSVSVHENTEPSLPRRLFNVPVAVNPVRDQYAMTVDGQRFLVIVPDAPTQRLTVLNNWHE